MILHFVRILIAHTKDVEDIKSIYQVIFLWLQCRILSQMKKANAIIIGSGTTRGKKKIKIVIPLMCRSKKNNQQMIFKSGRKPTIIQSKLYLSFERECGNFLRKYSSHIDYPINLKCTFYVSDRRKRDIVNLVNAIQDILVKYDVLADDNYNIVQSLDGTRIIYEKGREETIVEIEEL